MLLETVTAEIPAQAEIDADIAEYGEIGSKCRAQYGEAACHVGDPDHEVTDVFTSASDTIANILHWVAYEDSSVDIGKLVESAKLTYEMDPS